MLMNIKSDKGFSLVELLTTIAIVAILTSIAMMGQGIIKKNRLKAASKGLYADLKKVRQDAMTKSIAAHSRGFGVRFNSNSSYTIFEFNDTNDNFTDDGTGEESNQSFTNLPEGCSVTLGATGDPTGTSKVLLYDKRGLARPYNWSSLGGRTYVVTFQGVSDKRCVVLDDIRIREGTWDGSQCNPS